MSAVLSTGAAPRAMPGAPRHMLVHLAGWVITLAAFGLFWQVMSWLAGTSALAPPGPSLAWAWRVLSMPRYWPHIQETFLAFCYA
jgi:hypothetical protein